MGISCSKDDKNFQDNSEQSEKENQPLPPGSVSLDQDFVLDNNRLFVSYTMSNSSYNSFTSGDADFATVSNKVYQHFKDDFDFIFILSVEEEQPDGLYYGISQIVKNDVQGTGGTLFDNTAAYGSAGKLKSVIHLPRMEYVVSGPFLHEIAHYWGNRGFVPTTVSGHWGYASVGGQLGGFDEIENMGNNAYRANIKGKNGFGVNANGGNNLPYGNAELYIMGLIDETELEPIRVADNPKPSQEFGQFTADAILTYTPADLVNQHGARVPAMADAQKDFNAITVVITPVALNEEQRSDLNRNLENFARAANPDAYWGNANNFWQATQQKARISLKLSPETLK